MPFSFLLFSQPLTCKEVHDPTSPASSLVQPARPILIPSRLRNDAPVPSGPGMWFLWPVTSKVVWLWSSPPSVWLQAVLCKKQFIFIDDPPPSHFSWNPLHRGSLWGCEAPMPWQSWSAWHLWISHSLCHSPLLSAALSFLFQLASGRGFQNASWVMLKELV